MFISLRDAEMLEPSCADADKRVRPWALRLQLLGKNSQDRISVTSLSICTKTGQLQWIQRPIVCSPYIVHQELHQPPIINVWTIKIKHTSGFLQVWGFWGTEVTASHFIAKTQLLKAFRNQTLQRVLADFHFILSRGRKNGPQGLYFARAYNTAIIIQAAFTKVVIRIMYVKYFEHSRKVQDEC